MGNLPTKPSDPPITEQNVGDQSGKVYMITGATSGIGRELAQILYANDAIVWIVARSKSKAEQTMSAIRQAYPGSKGVMRLLKIDFNDLETIKPAVEEFSSTQKKLDVLWNNAGIMIPPKGTVTAQGYEAQLGVNALAPFLFTKLLTERLPIKRVVWVSSSAASNFAPQGGVEMAKINVPDSGYSQWQHYGISKAASILYSREFDRRYAHRRIVSVSMDPGNLETDLYVNMPKWQLALVKKVALKPAIYGAYTELYAGLSEEVASGAWVVPWGKVATPREDIDTYSRLSGGVATKFWDWSEKEVQPYV